MSDSQLSVHKEFGEVPKMIYYAHTANSPDGLWLGDRARRQRLVDHLQSVAEQARRIREALEMAEDVLLLWGALN